MRRKHALKLSANDIERKKIFFQFALMLMAAFIGGLCFVAALDTSISHDVRGKIISSFSGISLRDFDLMQFVRSIITACLPYFVSVLIIFVFSFSYVSYVVSDILLALNSFFTGVLVALVALCLTPAYFLSAAIFIVCTVTSLLVLMYFAYTCALLSLGIRLRVSNGRMIFSGKKLLYATLKTIATLGTFIILTFIRSIALLI